MLNCWGTNRYNQLDIPSVVQSRVNLVSVGHDHTCVLYSYSQKCKCWGNNNYGQLDIPNYVKAIHPPRHLTYNNHYKYYNKYKYNNFIEAGLEYTCVIWGEDRFLICFGNISKYSNNSDSNKPTPSLYTTTQVFSTSSISSVSLGGGHGCYITPFLQYNKLICYGTNTYGQIDIPNGYEVDIMQSDLGYAFSCGLYHSHNTNVLCWGGNSKNQLDVSNKISGLKDIDLIAVGDFHVCAKSKDRTEIVCWGDDEEGNVTDIPLIYDRLYLSLISIKINSGSDLGDEKKEFTTENDSMKDKEIFNSANDWEDYESINDNIPYFSSLKSSDVDDMIVSVEEISAGYNHNCGVFKTYSSKSYVKCWGKDDKGQVSVPDDYHVIKSMMKNKDNINTKDGEYDESVRGTMIDVFKNVENKLNVFNEYCFSQKIPKKRYIVGICLSLIFYNVKYSIYSQKDLQEMSNCSNAYLKKNGNDYIETCKLNNNNLLVKNKSKIYEIINGERGIGKNIRNINDKIRDKLGFLSNKYNNSINSEDLNMYYDRKKFISSDDIPPF